MDISGYANIGDNWHYCVVYDISPGGTRIRLADGTALTIGDELTFDLEDFGQISAEVRNEAVNTFGLMFLHDDNEKARLAQHLLATKPPRRQERVEVNISATFIAENCAFPCIVTDMSRMGAAITIEDTASLCVSDEGTLLIPGHGPIKSVIRRIADNKLGMMLLDGYAGELPPRPQQRQEEPLIAQTSLLGEQATITAVPRPGRVHYAGAGAP